MSDHDHRFGERSGQVRPVPRPTGDHGGRRGRHRRGSDGAPTVPRADFRSYYGLPVLNPPVWETRDIAGYLFLGGLAGASSLLGAGAQATGRTGLARASKLGAGGAVVVSLAASCTTWAGRNASCTCCACSSRPPR